MRRIHQVLSDLALLPRMWRALVASARQEIAWEHAMALQAEVTRTKKERDLFVGDRNGPEWRAVVDACRQACAARDVSFADPLISGGRRG